MSRTYHHGSYKPWVRRPDWAWMHTPDWWTTEFVNRPKRTANRRLNRKLTIGHVDADNVPLPLGNRKPHIYYW